RREEHPTPKARLEILVGKPDRRDRTRHRDEIAKRSSSSTNSVTRHRGRQGGRGGQGRRLGCANPACPASRARPASTANAACPALEGGRCHNAPRPCDLFATSWPKRV